MTTLEEFAAAAMQGMLAAGRDRRGLRPLPADIAHFALEHALALREALNKHYTEN